MRSLAFAGLVVVSTLAPRAQAAKARPASISTGPKLALEHQIDAADEAQLPSLLRREEARLRSMRRGEARGIRPDGDLRNYLTGYNGLPGAIQKLREKVGDRARPTAAEERARWNEIARGARDRMNALLAGAGLNSHEVASVAELMVWRGLSYNSSTLAHGSFGPGWGGNVDLQAAARQGLLAAVDQSFRLSERLKDAVEHEDRARFFRAQDVHDLHAANLSRFPADLPQIEPGRVRDWTFGSGFGVAAARNNRGIVVPASVRDRGNGSVLEWRVRMADRLLQRLTSRPGWAQSIKEQPLFLLGATEYALHNEHWYRDGNGRSESLLNYPLARAAGFPVPLEYDQHSGAFRLAVQRWGGTRHDLYEFLAQGALAAERFLGTLLPVMGRGRIVSTQAERGTVASVVKEPGGERSLLVMVPITHAQGPDGDLERARVADPELAELMGRGRLVSTGPDIDPRQFKVQVAVNGRENAWVDVQPTTVHEWPERYPWWRTAEPIYKVQLPADARFVNFRIHGPAGAALHEGDYYVNLEAHADINQRLAQAAR
jgi:hypothetical protein